MGNKEEESEKVVNTILRLQREISDKDYEIKSLREALDKICHMKLEHPGEDYKYALNRCWHIATEALNPTNTQG